MKQKSAKINASNMTMVPFVDFLTFECFQENYNTRYPGISKYTETLTSNVRSKSDKLADDKLMLN